MFVQAATFYRLPKEFKEKRFYKHQPMCFITTGAIDWFTGSAQLNSCLMSCSLGAEHSCDTNPANKCFETFVKYKHLGRICYLIHQIRPFKAWDLFYVPPALTFRNAVFCPQCVYVFCVDLRTNINISLYGINLLVFITKAESAYCTVRTGSLNQIKFSP